MLELLLGDAGTAARRLSHLDAATASATADVQNDLAVAWFEAATAGGRNEPLALCRALDAVLTALELDPGHRPAAFNLGIIVARLGLFDEAARANRDALAIEGDRPWRAELVTRSDRATSALGEWESLESSLLAGTLELAPQTQNLVNRNAEPLQHLMEEHLLGLWGTAMLAGDRRAEAMLTRIERLAGMIARSSHDPLLSDTVRHLDASAAPSRRIVARGLVAFADGVTLLEETKLELAQEQFRIAEAALRQGRSPFRVRAAVQLAVAQYQTGDYRGSLRRAAAVCRDAESAGYASVLGRALALQGLALGQVGRTDAGLGSMQRAAVVFGRTGETEQRVAALSATAAVMRELGNRADGWPLLDAVIHNLSSVLTRRRRLTVLRNIAEYAADEGLVRCALLFQDAAVSEARRRGAASTIVESLVVRSSLRSRLGDHVEAQRDLDEAEGVSRNIESIALQEFVAPWVLRTRAESLIETAPLKSAALLDEALRLFALRSPEQVPASHLMAARALNRAALPARSRGQLVLGIASVEKQLAALQADDSRAYLVDTAAGLYGALIDSYSRDPEGGKAAFAVAERSRSQATLYRHRNLHATGLDEFQDMLPEGTAVLYYASLPTRLLTWVISRHRVELVVRDVPETVVMEAIRTNVPLIAADSSATDRHALAALSRLLLPERQLFDDDANLIIVPDRLIGTVPFAALHDRRSGRHLIETHVVSTIPSAAYYQSVASRGLPAEAPPMPLLVGGTADLPESSRELHEIAALYPRSTLIEPGHSSSARLRFAMGGADIFHFAGHARVNDISPWRSRLILGDGTDQVDLEQLGRLDLRRVRLVVLSSCETGVGTLLRGEGPITLARPFLIAGVPAVIGSLWKLEDRNARDLSVRFHNSYRAGHSAADALRQAQLELLNAGAPWHSWAGLFVASAQRDVR